ncbi:MAG: sirohydrochlorin chelatase [Ramlibacter sp.]
MRGFILFAHGSRDPQWRKPVEAVAQRLRDRAPGSPVRCAYLELTTPDLPTAAADLIAAGVRSVRITPVFLGTGKHAREDLPVLVEQLRQAHPAVDFSLQQPVGEDARLLDLIAQIAAE